MGQRILVADPRYMVCSGLHSFFLREFPDAYVEEAVTSEKFAALLAAHLHNVIIVHQSFLTAIPHFLEGTIIVLAPKPDKELFLVARTHYARAYLGNDHTEELLRAVLKLEPGQFLIDPAFADWVFEQVGKNGKQRVQLELLTGREREVAKLRNEGLTYEEIAERLYIAVSTVRQHVVNMGRKRNKM